MSVCPSVPLSHSELPVILVTVSHRPSKGRSEETWHLWLLIYTQFNFPPSSCLPEIGRVRKDMYNDTVNGGMFNGRDMEELPEAVGPVAQLQEKLYVPVKEYPDVSG